MNRFCLQNTKTTASYMLCFLWFSVISIMFWWQTRSKLWNLSWTVEKICLQVKSVEVLKCSEQRSQLVIQIKLKHTEAIDQRTAAKPQQHGKSSYYIHFIYIYSIIIIVVFYMIGCLEVDGFTHWSSEVLFQIAAEMLQKCLTGKCVDAAILHDQ